MWASSVISEAPENPQEMFVYVSSSSACACPMPFLDLQICRNVLIPLLISAVDVPLRSRLLSPITAIRKRSFIPPPSLTSSGLLIASVDPQLHIWRCSHSPNGMNISNRFRLEACKFVFRTPSTGNSTRTHFLIVFQLQTTAPRNLSRKPLLLFLFPGQPWLPTPDTLPVLFTPG